MQPGRRAAWGLTFMCVLAFWMETVQAGSSFLSPSQKPQGKNERKLSRVSRRFSSEQLPSPPENLDGAGKHIMFNAPFEIGISMTEEEFQEYGNVLQRIVQDILTDAPPAE